MKALPSASPRIPLTPFERHLVRKHSLPIHWVRTLNELRGGHR